jgi:hypothetical protein
MTMTLIGTTTVGVGGASSVTLSAIPGTYTDLLLLVAARSAYNDNVDGLRVRVNNDSSAVYHYIDLIYSGTTTYSFNSSGSTQFASMNVPAALATSSTFSNAQLYIPNYSGSRTKLMSADWIVENNSTAQIQGGIEAYRWGSTSAITSLVLYTGSGQNFVQNSTFALYGITKGSGGATVS